MADVEVQGDMAMSTFQLQNCRGCKFAAAELVGTGKPCCTYAFKLDIREGKCYTRRETKKPKED